MARKRIVPRDFTVSLTASAVVLAAMGNHAVNVGWDLASRDRTIPAFVGVEMSAILAGLLQYGRWVLDYASKAARTGELRREIRHLLGAGAAALFSIALHAGWAGMELARDGHTVPAFLGSTITFVMGALMQYGAWVLEFSEPGRRR